jgi:hypothetical protein
MSGQYTNALIILLVAMVAVFLHEKVLGWFLKIALKYSVSYPQILKLVFVLL